MLAVVREGHDCAWMLSCFSINCATTIFSGRCTALRYTQPHTLGQETATHTAFSLRRSYTAGPPKLCFVASMVSLLFSSMERGARALLWLQRTKCKGTQVSTHTAGSLQSGREFDALCPVLWRWSDTMLCLRVCGCGCGSVCV